MNATFTSSARAALAAAALALGGVYGVASAAEAQANLPAVQVTGGSLATSVTAAVREAVGDTSPDITIANQAGQVTLAGWARDAADVHKAVAAAGNVAGVTQVYASGVRLWSTRTNL